MSTVFAPSSQSGRARHPFVSESSALCSTWSPARRCLGAADAPKRRPLHSRTTYGRNRIPLWQAPALITGTATGLLRACVSRLYV